MTNKQYAKLKIYRDNKRDYKFSLIQWLLASFDWYEEKTVKR